MKLIESQINPEWLTPEGWEQILGTQIEYRLGRSVLNLWRVQWNQHVGYQKNTEPHAHFHHQILYYQRGEGCLEASGEVYTVQKGGIFFVPTGCQHRFLSGNGESALCLALDFTVAEDVLVGGEIGEMPIGDEGAVLLSLLDPQLARPFALGVRDQVEVDACIAAIAEENDRRELGYASMIQAYLLRLISLCLRATQRAQGFGEHFRHTAWRHGLIARRAQELIKERATGMCPEFTLRDIAKVCSTSPNQLNRILKRATGFTFTQILLRRRLEYAVALLQSGEANCTEAAFMAGFCDSSYFSRAFRKVYGYAPSDL